MGGEAAPEPPKTSSTEGWFRIQGDTRSVEGGSCVGTHPTGGVGGTGTGGDHLEVPSEHCTPHGTPQENLGGKCSAGGAHLPSHSLGH